MPGCALNYAYVPRGELVGGIVSETGEMGSSGPHIALTSPSHLPHIAHTSSSHPRNVFRGDVWTMCGRCEGDVRAM